MQHVISQIADRYGSEYRPSAIHPVEGGFSGAHVFRMECPVGRFALRLWPSDSLPAARIIGLHRLLREILAAGVMQVVAPILNLSGESLQRSDDQLWHLEPWCVGSADFHEQPSFARIKSALACLARWHQAARKFTPTPSEARWFSSQRGATSPAVIERLDLLRSWMHPDELREINNRMDAVSSERRNQLDAAIHHCQRHTDSIADRLRHASNLRVDIQPCIRDVWHDHLFFQDDELTGLIDCNACRTESVASDLARLLGSLFADDHQSRSTAIAAYQSHHALTADELILVDVLDRSGTMLSAMYWVREFVLERRTWAPDHEQRAYDRLATFVTRLRNDFRSGSGSLILP